MLRSLLVRSFALGCLLSTGGRAQAPTFVEGDPGRLKCKIVKVEARQNHQVLTIEVRNRSDAFAEPLRFSVTGRKPKRGDEKTIGRDTFDRARMPLVARFGEGIPPGKSRRFRVHTRVPKQRGLKVAVEIASFFEPEGDVSELQRPKVENLTAARGRNDFTGLTHDIAQFEVVNPFDRTADIWLLATFDRPVDEVALLAYRVEAGETRTVRLGSRAPLAGFDDSGNAFGTDVEIEKLEVVDWLQIGDANTDAARRAFLEALGSMATWPGSLEEVRASFTSKERGPDLQSGDPLKLQTKGTIFVGRDRKVRVEFDPPSAKRVTALERAGKGLSQDTEWIARLATRYLRWPPISRVKDVGEVVWMTPDSVLLRGIPLRPDNAGPPPLKRADPYDSVFPRFGLRDGRISFDGYGSYTPNDWQWKTEKLGKEWVVGERVYDVPHFTRQTVETWEYGREGGLPILKSYRHLIRTGDAPYSDQVLEFSDWEFSFADNGAEEESTTAKAPTGPGAGELEQAWNRLRQLEVSDREWSADVRIVNNGSDASWQGFDRFDAGLNGRGLGRSPDNLVLDMRGRCSSDVESALGDLYLDRVRLWFTNDLQTKGSFETFFDGATIAKPSTKGWFDISDHRAKRLRVVDGLVREVEWSTGQRQRFHYGDVDGVQMITRIERQLGSSQELLASFSIIDGKLIPTRFEFRAIFGDDWGPEIYTLSSFKLAK